MIQYRRRKSKLHEAATRRSRVRRLNEWNEGPKFCTEYSGILGGCDILCIKGDDYVYDLENDESWRKEVCEENGWDCDTNDEEMQAKLHDLAFDYLNLDIEETDTVANDEDSIIRIIRKNFRSPKIRDLFTNYLGCFQLHKRVGDWRGNTVEWIFDEEDLDFFIDEWLLDNGRGDRDRAEQKVIACCKEINQYVRDNSSAELSEYVR